MELFGKTALVTGGGSGIGLAIAKKFVSEGAVVCVCDRDEKLVKELQNTDPNIVSVVADVGVESDVDELFDLVLETGNGQLDILVNNAGIAGPNAPMETTTLSDWEATLRVNVISTFLCTRRALETMKKQKSGSIVNLSSTAGTHGYPLRTPYASAKWAVVGMTKSLAMEVGHCGIRVNAICPGSVSGPRMNRVMTAEAKTRNLSEKQIYDQLVSQTSLKTFVEVEDIAEMALFVCSERGARISGQALAVDGHTESLSLLT